MNTFLEHAYLHVKDIDVMLEFLLTAFSDFRIRHDSGTEDPERWVHVGNDEAYLALSLAGESRNQNRELYGPQAGFNHLGFVVNDVQAVRQRLLNAGYAEGTVPNRHSARKRVYFYGPYKQPDAGNWQLDWEFVQYLTEDRSQRHDYSQ